MTKPDLIVSWPDNCDYPLFRQYIRKHRTLFNEVIIVFTKTNSGLDFTEFVRMYTFADRALCVESPKVESGEDWRHVAVNAGLLHSLHSEYILFTEQDFLPTDVNAFWSDVEVAINGNCKVVGVLDGTRLHPCFLMIERKTLDQTSRNFAANPPKYDHFGKIQRDLQEFNPLTCYLMSNYHHMNGLSHNWWLVTDGQVPNYHKDEFDKYLRDCLHAGVSLDPKWAMIAIDYLGRQVK